MGRPFSRVTGRQKVAGVLHSVVPLATLLLIFHFRGCWTQVAIEWQSGLFSLINWLSKERLSVS